MNFRPRILNHCLLLSALALAATACSSQDYFPYGLGSDDMNIPQRAHTGSNVSSPNSDHLASDAAAGGSSGTSASPTNNSPALNSTAGAAEMLNDEPTSSPKPASLRVSLTDAPAQFDQVWVHISHVELGSVGSDASAWTTVMDESRTLDLLTLQNDVTAILGAAKLQPGTYSQLRLFVDSAEVVTGGEIQNLVIPSGAQTGIKINLDFQAAEGVSYALVLDFDAHESIRQSGNNLIMAPVIKVRSLAPISEQPIATESDAGATATTQESEDPQIADAGAPVASPPDAPQMPDAGAPATPEPNPFGSDAGDAG